MVPVILPGRVPGVWSVHRADRLEPPAPRQDVTYVCGRGHEFTITLTAGIEPPPSWDCRCGAHAARPGTADAASAAAIGNAEAEQKRHKRLVHERRSAAELEQILADRLAELAGMREAGQL